MNPNFLLKVEAKLTTLHRVTIRSFSQKRLLQMGKIAFSYFKINLKINSNVTQSFSYFHNGRALHRKGLIKDN